MAKVKIHLGKSGDQVAQLIAVFDVAVSDAFAFYFPTMKVLDKKLPLSPLFPSVTYEAIQATVESGAFYARHKANAKGLSVELTSFEMKGNISDPLPFAVATTIAIYDVVAGIRNYDEKELYDWKVLSVERLAVPN
jgi:hypothetical protein